MTTSVKSGYLQAAIDNVPRETPDQIASVFDRLWPLMRSITGEGVRKTHDVLGELVPMERIEVPTGTEVFDWTVPTEWVVREAYIVTPDGRRICDINDHTLHLVNYACGFRGKVSRRELDEHLHSLPDLPDAIPYVISYYAPRWGFCLPQRMRDALPEGEYDIVIDAEHVDGSLTLSEAVLPGDEQGEVLISTYTCHPSMANNELSGPLVAAFLYRRLAGLPRRRLTYRFVWLPETIGSLAYLCRHGEHFRQNLVAGYVPSTIGDAGPFTYKRSRRGDTQADRAALYALERFSGDAMRVRDFTPIGSDERQYCSPGFNLPVGIIARTIFGEYPEYHTSLDDRDFISFEAMAESVDACFATCLALECNVTYRNLLPYGEPQLGKRGLYPTLGAGRDAKTRVDAMRWLLNLADGQHDLIAIAQRSGEDLWLLDDIARQCVEADLLERADA